MFDGFDISQLPPEALAQLLGMSTLDEQGSALDEQMALAQALGQPKSQHHTPVGAALGGLADLLNQGSSHLQQQKLREQKSGLLDQKTKGRELFAKLLGGVPANGSFPNEWTNPYGGQ